MASVHLTIDQGNTAAKMALWAGADLLAVAVEEHLAPEGVRRFVRRNLNGATPDGAIYCSVSCRGADLLRDMRSWVRGPVLRLDSTTPVPLAVDYGTPGTLGTDRLAAAAGALAGFAGHPLLVVDAGTAVTYDYVTADGHFAGGNIAPGMTMRLQALNRFTARLPKLEMPRDPQPQHVFGTDTTEAMINGAIYGIVGALAYYRSRLPQDTRTVLTGGWGPVLARLCDFPVEHDPNLVSKGLNSILSYNEDIQRRKLREQQPETIHAAD